MMHGRKNNKLFQQFVGLGNLGNTSQYDISPHTETNIRSGKRKPSKKFYCFPQTHPLY